MFSVVMLKKYVNNFEEIGMKILKNFVALVFLSCLVFDVQVSLAKELKIGVVDFQKVLEESSVIRVLNKDLETKIKDEEDIITKRREEIQKKKEDFDKQQSMLNSDVRAQKEDQLRQELKDLQRYANDKQDEFQRKGSELMQKVVQELSVIVKEVGEKEDFTVVLERNAGVVFSDSSVDITDQVVKEYDKRHKK